MIENIKTVTPETIVSEVEAMKKAGYRLVTFTCTDLDENTIDLIYHFDKELVLQHLRMEVSKTATIPSVSGVLLAAFLIENEIQDQFGLKFDGIAIDFHGTLFLEDSVRPSPLCRYTVVEAKPEGDADAKPSA